MKIGSASYTTFPLGKVFFDESPRTRDAHVLPGQICAAGGWLEFDGSTTFSNGILLPLHAAP